MIIRPVVSREYTALPNAIFKDRRLSADTRAMVALVLSKPRPGSYAHRHSLVSCLAKAVRGSVGQS
jgi:hypothetical protein